MRSARTRLEALHIDVAGQTEVVDADALFILIGGVPTSGLVDWCKTRRRRFFLTGPDICGRRWSRHVVEART
jgi:hypothetical protein